MCEKVGKADKNSLKKAGKTDKNGFKRVGKTDKIEYNHSVLKGSGGV